MVFVRRFTGFDPSIVVGNDCVDSSDDVRLIVLNKLERRDCTVKDGESCGSEDPAGNFAFCRRWATTLQSHT